MKKHYSLLLVILLSFLLIFVSCNGDAGQSKSESGTSQGQSSGTTGQSEQPKPQSIDYTRWNSSYANYKIEYTEGSGFSTDCPYVSFIEKDPNKDFVILNLTDIQISVDDLNDKSADVILFKKTFKKLVDTYSPNLITITGDFGDYGVSSYSLKYIARYIDSFNIPWAAVFGNHDNESLLMSKKATFLEERKKCLFKTGPTDLATLEDTFPGNVAALGNYIINIVEGDKLVNSLIFMNTGNMSLTLPINRDSDLTAVNYGCLSEKQIKWYEWAVSSAQAYNSSVKSSLFVHIPIFEYANAICAALKGSHSVHNASELFSYAATVPVKQSTDDQYWNDGYTDSFGVIHDSAIATSYYEDNVFASIKKMGSTNLVICGHDHENNTVINQNGVQLVYGTKTGSGSYNSDDLSGGTKINITQDKTEVSQILYTSDKLFVLTNKQSD